MTPKVTRWAGVDVGAQKGFDVAVIDEESLVAGPVRLTGTNEVIQWLREQEPRVVAVDSPRSPAPKPLRSREGERDLVRAKVCGIRYTPNQDALEANRTYYGWILAGFELYDRLVEVPPRAGWEIIECFPTASWSRLGGRRRGRSRARWSSEVLKGTGLYNLPPRMNQDARDALGAALTAKLYERGQTERFGDIVVPLGVANRRS